MNVSKHKTKTILSSNLEYDQQGFLDQFGKQQEFWYVSRDDESANDNTQQRNGDKWWLPAVKVPPNGLSEATRKWLLFVKESVNQILKAAMAINAQVLTEMEVPESYIESLPKASKNSLKISF